MSDDILDFGEVDWDNVEAADGGYEPVKNGRYLFEVVEADAKPSKAGNRMLTLKVKVVDDEDGTGREKGKTHTERYTVTDKEFTQRRFKAICEALETDPRRLDMNALPGRRFYATATQQAGEWTNPATLETTTTVNARLSKERKESAES